MAGGRGRLHKPTSNATPRRSTRRGKTLQQNSAVPDVFQDLLSEATPSKAAGSEEDSKPLKKRKTAPSTRQDDHISQREPEYVEPPTLDPTLKSRPQPHPRLQAHSQTHIASATKDEGEDAGRHTLQTIIDSDESDDSDLEWEDALGEANDSEEDAEPEVGDISITIGGDKSEDTKTKKQVRRRGITSVDKKRRLDIHKMHILCLLYHVHRRNTWCNDEQVQTTLRRLPPPKTLSNLVPNPEYTQYQASKRFVDGIQELKQLWQNKFSVTALGMHKPRWVDADAEVKPFSDFDELDDPMDRQDFRKAASSLQGSQDVGAQLFCALLRGIGIDARLVCSLQCLPFISAAQPLTPQKPSSQKNTIVLDPYNTEGHSLSKSKTTTPSRPKRLSRLERLLGERNPALRTGVAPKQKKKYHAPYPVYWVEAFNPSVQKWIPADPLSTFTVNAPEKLEPPLSYPQNSLVYAVAFEDDSVAKDVTRRYAKAYNAKTRKFRVERTEDGARWWQRALKMFKRTTTLDRDQVEDAALARKEAAEGMPKNVQDFKDHPVYVLERHLKHNEVIHPMHQVGKVNVGTSMNPKMEPIYRHKDVHIVRSADKWYRLGRDVKAGEQPLKHAKPKKGARRSIPPDIVMDDQQEEVGTALYAAFQTELYVPPPVVRGRVPRNTYGNLDIYVPSMIPKGGAHIRHKLASKAARIVGVDCVDAVTGFSFKGRHGTAIVQGVVVAKEYEEAVEAVLNGMEYAQEEAEYSQRRSEALRMWRRFYLGLRIAQRVNAIEIDGETGPVVNVQEEIEREDREIAEKEFAGGFFPDGGDDAEVVAPVTRHFESLRPSQTDEFSGRFVQDENEEGIELTREDVDFGGGFVPEEPAGFGSSILAEQQLRPRQDDEFGGGFIPEEDEEESGEFIRDSLLATPGPSSRNEKSEGGFIQGEGNAGDLGGGFIIDDKPAEGVRERFIQDDGPAKNTDDGTTLAYGSTVSQQDQSEVLTEAVPELNTTAAVTVSGVGVKASEVETTESKEPSPPTSSPSDAGSLPLEDPEDEDADPEWLVDVT